MQLVGYVDYGAGMILCRPCGERADDSDGATQPLYDVELGGGDSPDTCDTCAALLDPAAGYGVRSCAVTGCGAVLAYPAEGAECGEHAATGLRG